LLHKRLAKAAARLERLDAERACCGDPNLGKGMEERIIWRELLDLELQEFDKELERFSNVTHGLVADGGMVARADGGRLRSGPSGSNPLSWSEIKQQPHGEAPPSLWRRLWRFLH
jgi:hypothetical protein